VRYNVTSLVTTGTNTATADNGKRKGSFDGRVNATDLNKGTYNATIVIDSNDPDENIVGIPVHLQVITLPHNIISASPSDLTPTQYVNITNTFSVSTDQVMIFTDTTPHPAYSINATIWTIGAGRLLRGLKVLRDWNRVEATG